MVPVILSRRPLIASGQAALSARKNETEAPSL
jgi:hypothetical protein